MKDEIQLYNQRQSGENKAVCELLASQLLQFLPKTEHKIWHGAPVWFLDGNPIVGYDVLKDGVQLLFWSGQSFDEASLRPEGSFKAAAIRYQHADQVDVTDLERWLTKAQHIQWDYKNIVKNKGVLNRLQ